MKKKLITITITVSAETITHKTDAKTLQEEVGALYMALKHLEAQLAQVVTPQ